MWIASLFRLHKMLKDYNRDRNLDRLMQTDWSREPLMRAVKEDIEARIHSEENQKFQQKQAEYLALQNQINPHFLYNTLEAIRADALMADCRDIAETTEALATFYRYTISNVQEEVTLSDELDNVENYFTVQQCRFGDKLSMEVEIENEKLLETRMPKLILQPLVENAIVHGLEGKIDGGTVRIIIENSDKRLFLRVRDDGLGFPEEQVDRMNVRFTGRVRQDKTAQETHRQGGIALVNVNSRIRLMFGEDYGLRIFSEEGVGTECILTMPLSYQSET